MDPIERLKELWYTYSTGGFDNYEQRRVRYYTCRQFAIDCNLVTEQEIENMEYDKTL